MSLASFPLLIKRWKKSCLHYVEFRQYPQLAEYLPEEELQSRLKSITCHIETEYPHIWLDTWLFAIAVVFVIGTAAFSVAARAINMSLWYPLILLIVPAAVAYITTARRNAYYTKLSKYYESLQTCLKEFNSLDAPRQIRWSCRRLNEADTAANLHLRNRLYRYNINLVIDINQIDLENESLQEGELLPAYGTSTMDVVLDIGPVLQRDSGNTSEYTSRHLTTRSGELALSSPPEYERASSIEMTSATPPPNYLPTHTINN